MMQKIKAFAASIFGTPAGDKWMDLFWGGPHRRITGLTVRILMVNAGALLMLLLGILYLGQVEQSLISARLQTFRTQAQLVTAALQDDPDMLRFLLHKKSDKIPVGLARSVGRFSKVAGQELTLFNARGVAVLRSGEILPASEAALIKAQVQGEAAPEGMKSVRVLKSMTKMVLRLLPGRREPAAWPVQSDYPWPGLHNALEGAFDLDVWKNEKGRLVLTAFLPVYSKEDVAGALMLAGSGVDIERDIEQVWLSVLQVFAATLLLTVILSIYLSGVIARPLRKLARAAEALQAGSGRETQIPDLSSRNDEIGELSVVLRGMTDALWARMDSIESFAADVAHEIKNPLTSLRSAVETAALVRSPGDRERLMQIILHDVARLDRLITDISDASRLDAELSRERHEPICLAHVLRALIDSYRDPLAREQRLADTGWRMKEEVPAGAVRLVLECFIGPELRVLGRENRIMQVFENMVQNALSFSEPGGMVRICSQEMGTGHVKITIEDQGPGIPAGQQDHIFERFYSERPTHEAFGQHSGLGLTIARQIVHAMGGTIVPENITRPDGKILGARFIVILPVVAELRNQDRKAG